MVKLFTCVENYTTGAIGFVRRTSYSQTVEILILLAERRRTFVSYHVLQILACFMYEKEMKEVQHSTCLPYF